MAETMEDTQAAVEAPQEDVTNAPETSSEGTQQTTLTAEEQRAMEHGWRPKEEFVGDKSKWVGAEEFLRRGELFEKIDSMGRDLRETKKALKMLQTHHEQLRQTEYKELIQKLKDEKKQAYEEGDHDKLVELDDQLLAIRADSRAEKEAAMQQAAQPDPRFVQWVGRNPWYTQDQELRNFGDEIGVVYAKTHPELSPDEVLQYVEGRVKKAFPEKFTNPNRLKPSSVSTGTTPQSPKDSKEYQLSDDERRVMQTFIRQGILTKEQYIADLKKMNRQ